MEFCIQTLEMLKEMPPQLNLEVSLNILYK